MRRALVVLSVAFAALFIAVPAWAHVSVRVDNPAPEAFAKYTVRVPNESEAAATTKIEVELPEEFAEARIQPLEGWDIAVTDGVLVIEGGAIEPGEFQEFSFSAQNPAEAGDVALPTIQTYDDGEIARWVGDADAEQPAPVVTIEGEAGGHDAGHGEETEGAQATETTDEAEPTDAAEDAAGDDTTSTAATDDDDDEGTDTLTIVALIAGLLGLVLGGIALARSRPAPRT